MSEWIKVCESDDLQPNSGICTLVDGNQIAIFYLPKIEAAYSVSNFDPIGKANVLSRGLIGDKNGEPILISPLYKEHYSLKTGQCLEHEDIRLDTYLTRIEKGAVELYV